MITPKNDITATDVRKRIEEVPHVFAISTLAKLVEKTMGLIKEMTPEDQAKFDLDLATYGTACRRQLEDGRVVYVPLTDPGIFHSPFANAKNSEAGPLERLCQDVADSVYPKND